MAFLKDDMAVELIREGGGRTLNGRILRSGRLAVEYSLLFQACVELLPFHVKKLSYNDQKTILAFLQKKADGHQRVSLDASSFDLEHGVT